MNVLTLAQELASLLGLANSFPAFEATNSHSKLLLEYLRQATLNLFSTLPREGLFYNEEQTLALLEGENEITLPSDITAIQVPVDLFIQDTALVGVDEHKHLIGRVDPRRVRNTVLTGLPSGFAPLDDTTIGFDAFADRDYTVTINNVKQYQPFTAENEVINYPEIFTEYIKYEAAKLYSQMHGFEERALVYGQTSERLWRQIQAAEVAQRPMTYSKGSRELTRDLENVGWYGNPY